MEKINLNIYTAEARHRFVVERDTHEIAEDMTAEALNGWYCMTCGAEVDECDCSDDDEDFDPDGMAYQEDAQVTPGLEGPGDAYYAWQDDHPCCLNCGEPMTECRCDHPTEPN